MMRGRGEGGRKGEEVKGKRGEGRRKEEGKWKTKRARGEKAIRKRG